MSSSSSASEPRRSGSWLARSRARPITGVLLTALACNASPDGDSLGLGPQHDGTGGVGGDSSGTTSASTGASSDGIDGTGQPPKYDLGEPPEPPPPSVEDCSGAGPDGPTGDVEFSYIWIANSTESTVSKIDTRTLEEVGRYRTHPGSGNPSRTSVNLNGNVAVANRNGGLVKFIADPERCPDRNGDGQIQTSTGKDDVLSWEDEECRAWYTPMAYTSQRPVAWTAGTWDVDQCRYVDTRVWTAGHDDRWGAGVDVVLADGETGAVIDKVHVPEVDHEIVGMYGGAVDGDGDFFATQSGAGHVVRVRLSDLSVDLWPQINGGYGMTVDAQGRVWTCESLVARLDPATSDWQSVLVDGGGEGGCMTDGQGTLWIGGREVTGVDTETLEIVAVHELDGGNGEWDYIKGISVDFEGYVWAVTGEDRAFRVEPTTGSYDVVYGLSNPYTYSDMTGFALSNASGWPPAG